MNKKALRIAGWALSLSMAVAGIGAAVGAAFSANGIEPIAVAAVDYTSAYSMSITKNGSNSNYTESNDSTYAGITWSIPGNQTLGDYAKLGGKLSSETSRSIYSKGAIAANIAKVDVVTGTKDSQITVKTMTVTAHSTAADAASGANAVATLNYTFEASKTLTQTKSDSTDLSNKFWRLTLSMTSSASSKNYGACIAGMTFYTEVASPQSITGATSAYIDETVTLTTNADSSVTWSVVDAETTAEGAKVTSGGIVSVTGAGSVKVKATASGYTDAYHVITFEDRPTAPYLDVEQDSYAKWVGDSDFSVSFTYGNIDDADVGDITFVSNHPEFADVKGDISASDGEGSYTVEVKAAGTATFTVSFGGNDLDLFEVVVSNKSISVSLDKTTATLWEGNTLTLTPTVVAAGYSDALLWESDDTGVATVSNGVVTPVAPGTATIKCSSADYPLEYAECVVEVKFLPADYYDLDLSTDQTTTASDSALTWDRTYANISIDKEDSGTNSNNYYPGTSGKSYTSTRFYKGSVLTIDNTDSCSAISFTATSENYATALANSTWTNATAVASSSNVMVYVTDPSEDVTCAIETNCGFSTIRFYVEKSWSEDFLDTFTCSGETIENPNGAVTVANPEKVWGAFKKSFGELPLAVQSSLKTESAGSGSADARAVERYDLVHRKYGYTDFIVRFSDGGANAANVVSNNPFNATADVNSMVVITIMATALVSFSAFAFLRRKKEDR